MPNKLDGWLTSNFGDWTDALRKIVLGNEKQYRHIALPSYKKVDFDFGKNPVCGREIKWCTTSELEHKKCQWVAAESDILGITPKIVCGREISTFECLRSISQKQTDITTIDSNYGYVARK